jgi:acetoin utilization protein AcuB
MSAPPVTIGSGESLQQAIDLLHKHNIRELPVVDKGGLVGIVTDRDVREICPSYPLFRDAREILRYQQNLKVAQAMTVEPLVVSPDAPLAEAAKLLYTYRIGSLPVVEDGKVVGVVSVTDILKSFIEQNER